MDKEAERGKKIKDLEYTEAELNFCAEPGWSNKGCPSRGSADMVKGVPICYGNMAGRK